VTTTTEEKTMPRPLLATYGHLCCGFCDARYDHAIVEDSPLTPRQQLRQAAARAGWKQTVADLDACPQDAEGVAAILIESWLMIWGPDNPLVPAQWGSPVMNGDNQQTLTIPAVAEPVAAGRRPYDSPKDAA
jgi:hypothetical protein